MKLGTGGLSRAYQAAAQQVLAESIRVPVFQTIEVAISSHIDDFGILQQLVEYFNNKKVSVSNLPSQSQSQSQSSSPSQSSQITSTQSAFSTTPLAIERISEDYDLDEGMITLTLRVLTELTVEMTTMLTDVTKGRGILEILQTVA